MSMPPNHAVAVEPLSYIVGQDVLGHWLALDTRGLAGGIFATREAALHFARDETDRRPGAVTMDSEAAAGARVLVLLGRVAVPAASAPLPTAPIGAADAPFP